MKYIRNDTPEKAAARLDKFLRSPPNRIHPKKVAARRSKAIRRSKPKGLLEECCVKQRWQCAYCKRHMSRKLHLANPGRLATLDHVHPISRGGTNAKGNVVAACSACNGAKGSLTVEEFRAAQAIETRRAETSGSVEEESAVPQGCATHDTPNPEHSHV